LGSPRRGRGVICVWRVLSVLDVSKSAIFTPKRRRAIPGEVSTTAKHFLTRRQAKVLEKGPASEEDLQTFAEMLQAPEGVEGVAEGAG
jgi:hypothetical protein